MKWQWIIALFVVLWILYMWFAPKETFGGVNPNDVIRIMKAAHSFPAGPAGLRNSTYALFSMSIYPSTIHQWTFQELQNLAANKMLNVPNVRFLLELDGKYDTHPAFTHKGFMINYPVSSNEPTKATIGKFVMNVGTPQAPMWVVSTK